MARRVKFRKRGQMADLEEAAAICLNQKRHDAEGNRLKGHSLDEILNMSAEERERVKQAGWLSKENSGG
jgi:hypothetical protein